MDKIAASLVFLLHSAIVLLFALVTRYGASGVANYAYFQDIHVMVAVGFGFVLAFLYKNAFTTVGHSFLLISFVALWAIINVQFWNKVFAENQVWTYIDVSLWALIKADYAAMAVLISFGAVVGRLSAQQLVVMAFFEVIFYSFNQAVAWQRYYVADVGGSMLIHVFGAYFGIAASAVLDNEASRAKVSRGDNKASKENNTFSLIGTLFLWCFFPSFNAALAGAAVQEVAVVNSYLALAGSCIMAYYASTYLSATDKFRVSDIQRATLAGGIAIGAVADMYLEPYAAILIGSLAGVVSVLGFAYVSPALAPYAEDTFGVHNVHGLPGIIGGLASVITARKATAADWTNYLNGGALAAVFPIRAAAVGGFDPNVQANFQLATLGTTLVIALAGGAFTGILIRELPTLDAFYDDAAEWQQESDVKAA